jgi:TATA-binding protein-associated factor Taf7
LPSSIPIFIVRRKRGQLPTDYKDFKVSRDRVYRWLRFLKRWNAAYARITIDERALDHEPDGGSSAYDQLRELVEEGANEGQEEEQEEEEAKDDNEDDDDEDDVDGGVEEGPVRGDLDDDEQVLYTGIGRQHRQIGTALERLQAGVLPNNHQREPAAAAADPVVVPWPERADEPLDEYKTEYLLRSTT